jgi:hypothetical protein
LKSKNFKHPTDGIAIICLLNATGCLNTRFIVLLDKHHQCHELRNATSTELENEVDVSNTGRDN